MRVISKALLAVAMLVALPFVAAMGQVKPTPPIRGLIVDSLRAEDIESIEIIKGVLAASYIGTTKNRQELLDTLAVQRRRWELTRPHGYAIRVLAIDHCFTITVRRGEDGLSRERLIVHDTTITARENAPVSEAYLQRCGYAWRVDDLFRDLTTAIADTNAMVENSIQYDPAYGFPRSYWVRRAVGRSGGVLVESFAPVR